MYRLLVIAMLIAQAGLALQLYYVNKDLSMLQGRTVYSIDKLQKHYEQDLSEMYSQGCRTGSEYEPGPPVVGFNPNSVVSYCSNKLKERKQLIDYLVDQVGR